MCSASASRPPIKSPPGLGIAKDSPERLKSGIKFTLSEATDEGHVFLPSDELVKRSAELLEAPVELVEDALDTLRNEKGVEIEAAAPAGRFARQPGFRPRTPRQPRRGRPD